MAQMDSPCTRNTKITQHLDIKMSTLILSTSQWKTIRAELHTEHPKSVFMLKTKMRQVLGFSVREHNEYVYKPSEHNSFDTATSEFTIRLDFYSERKYTMFLLKFSEYMKDNK